MMASRRLFAMAAAIAFAGVAPAAAKDVRIASHVSETSPLYATAQMFADRIGKEFPKDFTFKFYPNSQLGKEKALIDSVRLGSLEMAMVASSVLALDNKLGVFDLPWLFTDRAHVERAMAGPLGAAVKQRIEEKQGMIVLGMYENGFRHVINTKHAIVKPEDMKGLKIRVTGSKFKLDGFTAMGADPVPVPWEETFTALQQGVVDGAEAALYGFYEAKLFEVAKNLSLVNHTYSPSFLLVSKSFWGSLTEDQRKTFQRVADDITADAYKAAADLDKGFLDKMRASASVNEVDPKPFQVKAESVYTAYAKEYGSDWVDMIRKAQ
ncbi:MAG TPA: TRAP transporter substrate-binding protein [Hyphomicrobiales bacterium]